MSMNNLDQPKTNLRALEASIRNRPKRAEKWFQKYESGFEQNRYKISVQGWSDRSTFRKFRGLFWVAKGKYEFILTTPRDSGVVTRSFGAP